MPNYEDSHSLRHPVPKSSGLRITLSQSSHITQSPNPLVTHPEVTRSLNHPVPRSQIPNDNKREQPPPTPRIAFTARRLKPVDDMATQPVSVAGVLDLQSPGTNRIQAVEIGNRTQSNHQRIVGYLQATQIDLLSRHVYGIHLSSQDVDPPSTHNTSDRSHNQTKLDHATGYLV